MLQLATIEPLTLGLLKSLMSKRFLDQFTLVGGTALALQIGHRKSIDLDLFSITDIDTDLLLEQFSLSEILDLYSQKYQHSTLFHVIKSLAWFEDAEPQTLPDVLDKKVTWAKVKKRIVQAVSEL